MRLPATLDRAPCSARPTATPQVASTVMTDAIGNPADHVPKLVTVPGKLSGGETLR